jgi:hypothetical protein
VIGEEEMENEDLDSLSYKQMDVVGDTRRPYHTYTATLRGPVRKVMTHD